jgi:hypothetical protein
MGIRRGEALEEGVEEDEEGVSGEETMAMAVSMRWAMTQPAMTSRAADAPGTSKRYALDALSAAGVSGGEESATLIVSRRVVS